MQQFLIPSFTIFKWLCLTHSLSDQNHLLSYVNETADLSLGCIYSPSLLYGILPIYTYWGFHANLLIFPVQWTECLFSWTLQIIIYSVKTFSCLLWLKSIWAQPYFCKDVCYVSMTVFEFSSLSNGVDLSFTLKFPQNSDCCISTIIRHNIQCSVFHNINPQDVNSEVFPFFV